MNGLTFASSLIANLAWPVVAGGAIIPFRKPLRNFIGRVGSYEALGQKVTFGEDLAEAEESVDEAVESAEIDSESVRKQIKAEPSPIAREAEDNPSFAVISAWEYLSAALADLVGAARPDRPARGTPVRWLPELERSEAVSPEFVRAVQELRDLRNRVAHGQHNPTPGEAVAYADSAVMLADVARARANFIANAGRSDSGAPVH